MSDVLLKVGTALSADWLRPSRFSHFIAYSGQSQSGGEFGFRHSRNKFPPLTKQEDTDSRG
jgi:hypothetical protein